MESIDKIQSLIQLLDDPDSEVFETVSKNLLDYGPDVIPELERAWEFSMNEAFQQRVENLIQEIQNLETKNALAAWKESVSNNLIDGVFLVSKYQYPDLSFDRFDLEIETVSKDVWLELNDNLTALEKTRVLNYIFFETYGFSGNFSNFYAPQNNFLNNVAETRKGNPISLGIFYSLVAQRLDLPIYGVNLPKNFILAYLDKYKSHETYEPDINEHILFYINPFRKGAVFNRTDIENFLRSQDMVPDPAHLAPCSNQDIVLRLIGNLIHAYEKLGYEDKVHQYTNLFNLLK